MSDWEQGTLEGVGPPAAIEMVLKLGLVLSENHGQWQLEVRDASGGELLAMHSKHHFHLGDWYSALQDVGRLLSDSLGAYIDPF